MTGVQIITTVSRTAGVLGVGPYGIAVHAEGSGLTAVEVMTPSGALHSLSLTDDEWRWALDGFSSLADIAGDSEIGFGDFEFTFHGSGGPDDTVTVTYQPGASDPHTGFGDVSYPANGQSGVPVARLGLGGRGAGPRPVRRRMLASTGTGGGELLAAVEAGGQWFGEGEHSGRVDHGDVERAAGSESEHEVEGVREAVPGPRDVARGRRRGPAAKPLGVNAQAEEFQVVGNVPAQQAGGARVGLHGAEQELAADQHLATGPVGTLRGAATDLEHGDAGSL